MQTANINRLTPYLFIAPAAIVLAVTLMYPIGSMIYASFPDWNPSQRIGEADWVWLGNYAKLLSDAAFRESFFVTLKRAAIVVTLEMVIGVALALLLDRNTRGLSVLRKLFILPMMIAPIVVGLVWRYMHHPTIGIFNRTLKSMESDVVPWPSDGDSACASVIIADVCQWTPFTLILSLAALQSLPRSALEVARIDSATGWQQVIHIKLPLMLPVLIVTCLLRLIDAFKVLEVVLVLSKGGPGLSSEILSLRIYRTASEFRELGEAAAMSNYLLILLMVLTFAMFLYNKAVDLRTACLRASAAKDDT